MIAYRLARETNIFCLCPTLLSTAWLNTKTQSNLGRTKLSWFAFSYHSLYLRKTREGAQVRSLKAGTEAKSMEESFFWIADNGLLNYVSCRTQEHLPRYSTTHSGLGPLILVLIESNPNDLPDGSNYLVDVSSCQMILACVKSIKNKAAHPENEGVCSEWICNVFRSCFLETKKMLLEPGT